MASLAAQAVTAPTRRSRRRTPPAGRPLLTAEQFLDWLEPGVHADLIAGRISMHSPVSLRHADLVNFVDSLLRQHIEEFDLGKLYREVVAVRLGPRDVFLPDLCYFTKDQAARLLPSHAPFAPALVVEVLSPATARRDRGEKFAAYEAHGVQEYWLLDPEAADHHFYRRTGDILAEYGEGTERIESQAVTGFWLRRAWLDAGNLPAVRACLGEITAAARRRARG